MVKVRVHIHEFMGDFMSEDCFVDIELPYRPMKGDYIHLSHKEDAKILELALKKYTKEEVQYYQIESANVIKEVLIVSGSDRIQIEIG
jgi:hypothetical protein